MMSNLDESTPVSYVFDLHLLCGGYAYFSTITLFQGFDENNRDIRQPSAVRTNFFADQLRALGQKAFVIRHADDYQYWILKRGWAFVAKEVARELMPQWLKSHTCIKSALSTFTDVDISAPGALSRRVSVGKRDHVETRDGQRCLLCGLTADDAAVLTMQHVVPFSTGGETTAGNLVTLCKPCNEMLGANFMSRLYDLAQLPYGYDLALVKGELSPESIRYAEQISGNLMHTRCVVW